MRSYSVKENPIGFAVSEILRYIQTNILLLNYKDIMQDPLDNFLENRCYLKTISLNTVVIIC